ncbi:MAG TPA: metal ABC transporter permease [Williamwhitmania sp.]|nr:metal ABC transporter permease [Williamwhitmania sp.]
MSQLFQDIIAYPFLYRAFIAGLLLSVAAGIVGTYIVARRLVFLTGGITHASFGGIGMAYFAGINPIWGAFVFSIFSALGIDLVTTRGKVREDSAIGMLWSFGMAVGIIFIALTPGYAPNLMGFLFGSIVTVTTVDLVVIVAVNILVLFSFGFFFRWILYSAFDAEFAKTQNIPVRLVNTLMLVMVSITIVAGIRMVGIILLLSILTLPSSTANLFTRRFKTIAIIAIAINMVSIGSGLIFAFELNIPSGAAVVFVQVITFAVAKLFVTLQMKLSVKRNMSKNQLSE